MSSCLVNAEDYEFDCRSLLSPFGPLCEAYKPGGRFIASPYLAIEEADSLLAYHTGPERPKTTIRNLKQPNITKEEHGEQDIWRIEDVIDLSNRLRSRSKNDQEKSHDKALLRALTLPNKAPRIITDNGPLVYFIRSGKSDKIKIGYTSTSPYKRIKSMQTGNPNDLVLLATIPQPRTIIPSKRYALEEYAQKQATRSGADTIRGEWFRMSAPQIEYTYKTTLESLKKSGLEPFVA